MTELRTVTVPAHGRVRFTPGQAHLMLDNPTRRLRPGQHVRVTITFRHAGTVVVALPVVPLTGPPPTPSMSMSNVHVNVPVELMRCPGQPGPRAR